MILFIPPRRKLFDLGILLVLLTVFYFIHPHLEAITLFAFGFIWNWAASNDLNELFEHNKRYRLSLLKFVFNLQNIFLRPVKSAPVWMRKIISILPAGIFWGIVIFINESNVPWWPPFLGSIAFELLQIDLRSFKKNKETP